MPRARRLAAALIAPLVVVVALASGSAVARADSTTLGRTTIGAAAAGGGSGFIAVSGPYALSSATPLVGLSGYLRGGVSAQGIRVVVYADSGGQPGNLVAVSQQVTIAAGQPAGWAAFPLSGSPTLPAGGYWLGYWLSGSSVQLYYDDVPGSGRYVAASYSGTGSPPAGFGGGSSSTLAFSLYATLGSTSTAPVNTALPQITGTTSQGQQLSAGIGTWSGSPTGYAYQWRRCDTSGAGCTDIAGATGSIYTLIAADVGSTVRVGVAAANANGSTPATSTQTTVVQSNVAGTTLGRTSIGALKATGGSGYVAVSGPYSLGAAATLTKLSGYIAGGGSPLQLRAVVYADNGSGRPGALVTAGSQVTVSAGAAAGWVDLPVAGAPSLDAGEYWLGYWFGGSSGQEYYGDVTNAGRYAAVPTRPPGARRRASAPAQARRSPSRCTRRSPRLRPRRRTSPSPARPGASRPRRRSRPRRSPATSARSRTGPRTSSTSPISRRTAR